MARNDRPNHQGATLTDQTIVVVSGLPRSGTSMMMNMLEKGGLSLLKDGIRVADEDNPEGYYEYEPVKGLKESKFSWIDDAQGKAVKVISYLLLRLPDTYRYRIIFMHRDLDEIIASQRKMLIRRGENPDKVDDEKMKAILKSHLAEVNEWLQQQANIAWIEAPYKQIVQDPKSHAERINRFLDDALDVEKMIHPVDPRLYRQRK